MTTTRDVLLADGRMLRVHDTGPVAAGGAGDAGAAGGAGGRMALLWHHGSPQTGSLLPPLIRATAARGIRLFSYGRPSYGGSTPRPGRNVASAAADVEQIADALGIDKFATMGASGGGPHALACAALLPDRVTSAVCLAGVAPYSTDYDWFAGMASPGALRAALQGRDARAEYEAASQFDPNIFTAADWAMLNGEWASLGADSVRAGEAGPDGLIDDDMAFATPWGFDVAQVKAPVLFVQGGEDRVIPPSHADWLTRNCRTSELWLRPRDGHVSVLGAVPVALDWLLATVARA